MAGLDAVGGEGGLAGGDGGTGTGKRHTYRQASGEKGGNISVVTVVLRHTAAVMISRPKTARDKILTDVGLQLRFSLCFHRVQSARSKPHVAYRSLGLACLKKPKKSPTRL